MDTESEIRQPLQMFGLVASHRVRDASFRSRVSVLVAADPLLLTWSDSIGHRNLMRGAAPTFFARRH